MTVNEIIEQTGQKRGTVEQFRNELQKYKIIANNESLDDRAVGVFRKSIEYKKEDQNTWTVSMQKAIQEEYGEELELPFYWTNDIILKHLIWQIKNGIVSVEYCNSNVDSIDFHVVYEIIIDNFKELGKVVESYQGSFGTDGNPTITYKCIGNDYIYYIVGKYNHITKSEDIHVFYNKGIHFNIIECKHVCGGNCNRGRLEELRLACWELLHGKKNS